MKYRIEHETDNEKEYREIMDVINHYYYKENEKEVDEWWKQLKNYCKNT